MAGIDNKHSCCNKEKVKKGLWSPEEDEILIRHVTTHGLGSWSQVPRLAGLQRCGKSCRLRWTNYLRPDLKKGNFTPREASIILEAHRIVGNRWSQIAKLLPGRTDNEVKNFWNSSIKKKLVERQKFLASLPRTRLSESYVLNPSNHNLHPNDQMHVSNPHQVVINPMGYSFNCAQMPPPSIRLPPTNYEFVYDPQPIVDPNRFQAFMNQTENFVNGFDHRPYLNNSQLQSYGDQAWTGINGVSHEQILEQFDGISSFQPTIDNFPNNVPFDFNDFSDDNKYLDPNDMNDIESLMASLLDESEDPLAPLATASSSSATHSSEFPMFVDWGELPDPSWGVMP